MSAAAPRLGFLYPIFYRSVRRPQKVSRTSPKRSHSLPSSVSFSTNNRRQHARPQRYGSAQEPLPPIGGSALTQAPDKVVPKPPLKAEKPPVKAQDTPKPLEAPPKPHESKQMDAAKSTPSTPIPDAPRAPDSHPMETVLHMPSPSEEEAKKPPHLQTPPYVHHFDTYSLVKDLEASGFKQDSAVTIMKAVRSILTDNMELAKDGLVSKSNVENETYLFRAACSELRTEIANNRNSETEKMRTARTHLQHEVDILNQRMTQDSLTLKDDLKGMFDDRKMAVRTEQRNMETKIQELNYKITVALNSDARSDVEGLRWVLTRRAAIAVGICAVFILGTLRYSSYMTKTQEAERKKLKEAQRAYSGTSTVSQTDGSPMAQVRGEEAAGDHLLVGEGGVQLG